MTRRQIRRIARRELALRLPPEHLISVPRFGASTGMGTYPDDVGGQFVTVAFTPVYNPCEWRKLDEEVAEQSKREFADRVGKPDE